VVLTVVVQYYARTLSSPLGLKVQEFYTTTTKRVHDIHEEAKRIAGWDKSSAMEEPVEAGASTKAA